MSLQIKRDDNDVFVATDPDIPGLLVVSKNRNLLEDVLVPKAIADLEITRLTARIAEPAWQPIDTAPYSTPVEVRVGSMTFLARLESDASLSDDEQPCDQWQAVNEGEHPPCWSEGACWSSNTDEVMSRQPEAWRFARTTLEASERGSGK